MSGVNKAIVVGRIGREPELRTTAGGASVCNFSVATDDRKKNQDGTYSNETDWHSVVAFGKTADAIVMYSGKGCDIYVEGRMKLRTWDKDGVKQSKLEILADKVQFIGRKADGPRNESSGQQNPSAPQYDDNELPF